MATLYLDFENGNDNYAGTSFSLLASGTDGRISSTTFSSAGASFPNDGSLIGQYLSIFNGTIYAVYNVTAWVSSTSLTIAAISGGTALANQTVDRQYYIGGRWKSTTSGATAVRTMPGDTIRIMGSPAPTSLGINGTWTSQALQATKSITNYTATNPSVITVANHGYTTGDTVVIVIGSAPALTGTWEITVTGTDTFTIPALGVNGAGGTVRLRNNTRIKLASAVTQNIACTGPDRAAWTSANANISIFTSTTINKEHRASDQIQIATAFTTGKAAYYTLPSVLDLSAYQQLSLWIYSNNVSIAGNCLELRLCSDTTGDVAVNTFAVSTTIVAGRWTALTIDSGAAMGASIASIALYVTTDVSTSSITSVYLSNIIACKASSAADSLTLTSLIGKNTTGETWWGIQSINGTRVMLDADTNATPTSTSVRGYYGTSETVTTWKRETIKLGPASSSTTSLQTIQESGTDGNPITYSGGWDRTAMSTQNLETWLDGVNGNGQLDFSFREYVDAANLACVRCYTNAYLSGNTRFCSLSFIAANNNQLGALNVPTAINTTATFGHIVASLNNGINLSASTVSGLKTRITHGVLSNGSTGFRADNGAAGSLEGLSNNTLFANNGSDHIYLGNSAFVPIKNIKTEAGPTSGAISFDNSATPYHYITNCLIAESTQVRANANYISSQVCSQNHDRVVDNHKIFMDGGLISSATDQRNTASGISWKLQPTSSTLRNSYRPVTLSLAKVACAANSLVTVKAWMRRDNTGLTMRLVCKGGQIAGVASDVVSSMTAAADTWEELTITFTPTEVGVVEITAEAWGGTTYSGWVDDITISQA